MSDSGIGMLLGHLSANLLWLWFIGAFLLGAVLVYGVSKSGRLRRSERAQLDRNTEARQRQEDPRKRPT
ncbi:cytochrome c-type biogenesis protein CcmH/NrfF [Bradyrhizobium sp. LB1.3]|jgi:cytochrome c-type biogenesis protein CcmH/NrfF